LQMSDSEKRERVPYFRYAFHNVYNYTMLSGVAAAALLTLNWWLAVVGGGIEALWIVFAPDSKALRYFWFDKVHAQNLDQASQKENAKLLAGLPISDARRVHLLEQKRVEIPRLCGENRAFTAELLRGELDKLEQLVASFIDLMISSHKHETYLQT